MKKMKKLYNDTIDIIKGFLIIIGIIIAFPVIIGLVLLFMGLMFVFAILIGLFPVVIYGSIIGVIIGIPTLIIMWIVSLF